MNYYTGKNQSDINSKYKFSNYAWGDDYHKILKKRIYELLRWIKEESLHTKGLVCVDTSPVMDKAPVIVTPALVVSNLLLSLNLNFTAPPFVNCAIFAPPVVAPM